MSTLEPRDEADAAAAIGEAIAAQTPLHILGHGTKIGLGRPVTGAQDLSLRALSGVVFYEPAELVLSCRPATPLSELQALLRDCAQEFAFEPPDFSGLYGHGDGAGTIGGTLGINAGGSRRIKAGAARDHLLGFRAVTGRGDIVKSGGRVMKNVTGYDLSKLVCGSFGTLAALTEVTLKVLPRAETETTLLLQCADETGGLALLRAASGLSLEVSSLALLPPSLPPLAETSHLAALRLEGPALSVAARAEALIRHFAADAPLLGRLDQRASTDLWRDLREATPLAGKPGDIWKISTAPATAPVLRQRFEQAGLAIAAHYFDWAGGLIWLRLEEGAEPSASIHDLVQGHGTATLMRASEARRAQGVFQPLTPALAALNRRVKDSFDPHRLFNRGRLAADL